MTESVVLSVNGLSIGYRGQQGLRRVVHDVSLDVRSREILGLVGESGCGKSTLALAAMGYVAPGAVQLDGDALYRGMSLSALTMADRQRLWGRDISYVPQDAGGSLHPMRRIGSIFDEHLRRHSNLDRSARKARAIEILDAMRLRDPARILQRYCHQLSGGQQQRVALALALALEPAVLVLDEPTTGADVTIQAEITALLRELLATRDVAALYISHDIALLSEIADRLAVMYAGQLVEEGETLDVLESPGHPYTADLISAVPRRAGGGVEGIPGLPPAEVVIDECSYASRCSHVQPQCRAVIPLSVVSEQRRLRCVRHTELSLASRQTSSYVARKDGSAPTRLLIDGVRLSFRGPGGVRVQALDGVTLEVAVGRALGLVGESGSGKSSLLRVIAGLTAPQQGNVLLEGKPLASTARRRSLDELRAIQLVFQNPDGSLNPRLTAGHSIESGLIRLRPELNKAERAREVVSLVRLVHLDPALLSRYPHQLSGGQKQRVALARALAAQPRVLLCDEVVSALDVSVQAGVLNLLAEIVSERGCTLILVSHDLAAVRVVADEIAVLRDGRLCELGSAAQVLDAPEHAYSRLLVSAIPGRF